MSGIVIRDLAMAEAVPVGSWILDESDGDQWAIGMEWGVSDAIGHQLTHIAVPVADAQAMRAEMPARAAELREIGLTRMLTALRDAAAEIEGWVELLFPAAIFDAPPAPAPPAEVDQWECRSCIAWNDVEDELCQSCGRSPTSPPVAMPGMKRYAPPPPAPEPPAEVDPWEHLRHTISCRTAWCKTCHAAVAALDAHDAEARE